MSCAAPPEKEVVDLVWPLPPDKPRIKYLESIRSSQDLGKKKGFVDHLFGEKRVYILQKPYGVAVDNDGTMYIADVGAVVFFDFENKTFGLLGQRILKGPANVATSADGRVFVTDTVQKRLFVFSGRRLAATIGKDGEFESPAGVAIDDQRERVYVVDVKKHHVRIYSSGNYRYIGTIGRRGSEDGAFNFPTNIALDTDGNIYVTDTGNFRVQVFDPEGTFLRNFGILGDTPGSFARPKGISLDSDGHIYVVDAAFQNFQIFDREGRILLFVGEGGLGPGRFTLPAGMTIDREDKIYVVDQIPGTVQIFQYLSHDDEDESGKNGEEEQDEQPGTDDKTQ